MKASLSELRLVVRDILTETVTIETLPQKYSWVGPDTAKMLHNVVWRLAADVVKAKTGDSSSDKVKDVAADIGMSVGAHMDDLLSHLAGQQKPAPKAPPPMRSQSQAGSQPVAKRPTQ